MCECSRLAGVMEPHEIFNAQFGPLGKTTMYMSRVNRQVRPSRLLRICTEHVRGQCAVSQMISYMLIVKCMPASLFCSAGALGACGSVLHGAEGLALSCPPVAHASARMRRIAGLQGSSREGA